MGGSVSERTSSERRIVVVSNRLPFTVKLEGDELLIEGSAGGLVSGLSAWLETLTPSGTTSYTWVGWPGITVEPQEREELDEVARERFKSYPVYLSDEEMEHFYQGFCNSTIWPLFHYFPSYVEFHAEQWKTYERVNRAFAEAVLRVYRPGDIVWVHDYHLMLLPQLLRERLPHAPIGFFLHIPFPSYEMLRMLPTGWRDSILEGLLGADLLGFHAHDYTDHFLRSVQRFLKLERSGDCVLTQGSGAGERLTRAATFPMGIDYARYAAAAQSAEAVAEKERLRSLLGERKVILSLDRLDYTKGIVNRLRGYELFLGQNPEWHGKVVMALGVTPSRIGVKQYQQTKQAIESLVSEINGRFGRVGWTPVIYQYKFVPMAQLAALYSLSDIALITPLRDGMNLVSKEYLASRLDGTGVLVLSVLAGAAEELGEAVLVNPNSLDEIAWGVKTALEMPRAEQIRRNRTMQDRIKSYDVTPWAWQFIRELLKAHGVQQRAGDLDRDSTSTDTPSPTAQRAPQVPRIHRRRVLLHQGGTLLPLPVETGAQPTRSEIEPTDGSVKEDR